MQNAKNQHWVPLRVAHGICSEAANEDLRRRIVNTLHAQQIPGAALLEVESYAGLVVVRGRLPSSRAKRECVGCCRRIAGVITLADELEVDVEIPFRLRTGEGRLERPE
jgi:osmotically-inducible protein OsmY